MAINSYLHVTPAGAGTKDGTTWAKAMGEAEFEAHLEGTVVAGDVYFVKEGTYTLDSAIDSSARDGTATAPIVIIGVKSATTNEGANVAYSDWATGANRPFFDCATYQFSVGDYYVIRNIDFQGEASNMVSAGISCVIANCKFDQDYASSAARYSLYVLNYCIIIGCEFLSTKCNGVMLYNGGCRVLYCYFHDMPDTTGGLALRCDAAFETIAYNIFDTVYVGIYTGGYHYHSFINNTFYEAATGISGADSNTCLTLNTIFSDCDTDAIKWLTQTDINLFWNNNFYNNGDDFDGVDETTVFQDYAKVSGDPKFTTAGSDFSLDTGSPCLQTGMSIELGV